MLFASIIASKVYRMESTIGIQKVEETHPALWLPAFFILPSVKVHQASIAF